MCRQVAPHHADHLRGVARLLIKSPTPGAAVTDYCVSIFKEERSNEQQDLLVRVYSFERKNKAYNDNLD